LARGLRLDERHVPERDPSDAAEAADAGRHRAHRRDRVEVRGVNLGRTAAATDPGRRRRHNEDAYVCEPPLFAVADGIGGAQAGELASSLAAAAVRDDSSDGRGDGRRRVDELIQEANRRVYQRQSEDASLSGMGTTMTVALFEA